MYNCANTSWDPMLSHSLSREWEDRGQKQKMVFILFCFPKCKEKLKRWSASVVCKCGVLPLGTSVFTWRSICIAQSYYCCSSFMNADWHFKINMGLMKSVTCLDPWRTDKTEVAIDETERLHEESKGTAVCGGSGGSPAPLDGC